MNEPNGVDPIYKLAKSQSELQYSNGFMKIFAILLALYPMAQLVFTGCNSLKVKGLSLPFSHLNPDGITISMGWV